MQSTVNHDSLQYSTQTR